MEKILNVFWLVPVASIVALGMALYFFLQMKKEDEGTPRMREIAEHVRKVAVYFVNHSLVGNNAVVIARHSR